MKAIEFSVPVAGTTRGETGRERGKESVGTRYRMAMVWPRFLTDRVGVVVFSLSFFLFRAAALKRRHRRDTAIDGICSVSSRPPRGSEIGDRVCP